MPDSKGWAAVVGPTVMVLAATEALNLQIWSVNIPQVVWFNGIALFAALFAVGCIMADNAYRPAGGVK